jgi:hypothetical protein
VLVSSRVSLRSGRVFAGFVLALFLNIVPTSARALGTCGDVDCSGSVTASDALAVLKKAVSIPSVVACPSSCGSGLAVGPSTDALVVCGDFNCSASVTAGDALSLLKFAVGGAVNLQCGTECPGVSTTTSTTLPPTNNSGAAVAVVDALSATANLYGNPTNPENARKVKSLAAYSNLLVESDTGGTLANMKTMLDALTGGAGENIDLSGCTTNGSGNVSFSSCAIGSGTTLSGSIAGSGNTFSLDLTFTYGTTTVTMTGDVTVTSTAMTGTVTISTKVVVGSQTTTTSITETLDLGMTGNCPTSGTVTFSWHIVEKTGETTTSDEQSGFTATYGPSCGDATFAGQTTTTTPPATTTTIGGQTANQLAALEFVTNVYRLRDLATGFATDGDKFDRLAIWADNAAILGQSDSSGVLFTIEADSSSSNVVQQPDPACASRVGGTTTYTNCSIDYGRFSWNGTLTVNGDQLDVELHFNDLADHKRDLVGSLTVSDTSVMGSLNTLLDYMPSIIRYYDPTTLTFSLTTQSGCAKAGTMKETYDLQTIYNGQVVSEAKGNYTATYGPACGQVQFTP